MQQRIEKVCGWLDRFAPEHALGQLEELTSCRYIVSVGVIYILCTPYFAFIYAMFGIWDGATALVVCPLFAFCGVLFFRRIRNPWIVSSMIVGAHFLMILYAQLITGGATSSVAAWALVTVTGAALVRGISFASFWAVGYVLGYMAMASPYLLQGWVRNRILPGDEGAFFFLTNFPLPFVVLGIAWAFRLETHRAMARETEKSRQLKIQQANAMSAAKMAALGEMAGGISHEINNPLAVIRIASEGLMRMVRLGRWEPKYAEVHLERIAATTTRISGVVQGLLAFSREGRDLDVEVASLQTILEDALLFCQERFRGHGVRLETRCFTQGMVLCNKIQISQVLLNLLNNAFYATKNSSVRKISIEISSQDGFCELRVKDNGHGVLPEFQDRIFEPFFTTKRLGEGTGLGLSLSKGIVESHGGTLSLESAELDVGSTFLIRLPESRQTEAVSALFQGNVGSTNNAGVVV